MALVYISTLFKDLTLIIIIHLLTLNQCTMSHNSLFFIIITLHKRELHPEREYTINKTERRSGTEKGPKSLYRSRAWKHFYRTENDI
jgi:hypothetical protein